MPWTWEYCFGLLQDACPILLGLSIGWWDYLGRENGPVRGEKHLGTAFMNSGSRTGQAHLLPLLGPCLVLPLLYNSVLCH